VAAIQRGDLIISTPEKWDQLTRKWRSKKVLLQVGLYIFDDLHLISDRNLNVTLEVVASRVRTIQNEVANNPELVNDSEI
jgi:pre-mRNA-splicing helicase BRR2